MGRGWLCRWGELGGLPISSAVSGARDPGVPATKTQPCLCICPNLARLLLDNPTRPFSSLDTAVSADARTSVGKRLLAVAEVLEREFGGAQVGAPLLGGWGGAGPAVQTRLAAVLCWRAGGIGRLGASAFLPDCCRVGGPPASRRMLRRPPSSPLLTHPPHPSLPAPQDVEGCFVGDDLFVVQTRPQP